MPYTIGIDVATTYCKMAVLMGGEVKMIPNSEGEILTPSVVGVTKTGRSADLRCHQSSTWPILPEFAGPSTRVIPMRGETLISARVL